jgi:hypothetical protein
MFGKKKKLPIDVDQVIAGAVEAAFGDTNGGTRNGDARQGSASGHDHRVGGVAAVAAGIVIAGAARAVYKRARELSLEQVAEKAEQRLQNSAS